MNALDAAAGERLSATAAPERPAVAGAAVGPARPEREEPLIKIRPGRPSVALELGEAWAGRELFYLLIWRDLKVRYRQAALGAAWVVLHPLLTALVFTVFMSWLARVPSDGVPYPLFAYAGLLPWTFFSNSVSTCSYSLISNSHIITKVHFPRLIIPAAAVGVRLFDLVVASAVMIALMPFFGATPGAGLLLLPLVALLAAIFTTGVGLWFAALNAEYRDLGTALPVLIQLWMFASPVIYPSSLVPPGWRTLYSLNPLTGIVEGTRAALFGLPVDWGGITISAFVSVLVLAASVRSFCRRGEGLVESL